MTITRRSFLGYCIASAAALKLTSLDLLKLQAAMANPNGPNVIWLVGAGDSGCSISFLNRMPESTDSALGIPAVTTEDLLLGSSTASSAANASSSINLIYHPTLMSAAGETASQAALDAAAQGNYILVVEGGVPTAFNGACCWAWSRSGQDATFQSVLTGMAANASSIVAVGTCAAFGGVSASGPNPGKVVSVQTAVQGVTSKIVLNIPGCPPHPDWMVWAIAQLLLGNTIANISLDAHNRPLALYGNEVHDKCPRNVKNNPASSNAQTFGVDNLCLQKLGCNGPGTFSPCPSMKWNNGANWCVDANANCLGCVQPTFPNAPSFPDFYVVPNS